MFLPLSVFLLGAAMGGQTQPAPAQAPAPTPVTEVMAIMTLNPSIPRPEVLKVLPEEVRATVQLYLNGKIDQWYSRADGKGVVFLLRCNSVSEATALMDSLPLHKAGYMTAEYMPLGPLGPLRVFVGGQMPGATGAK